MYLGYYIKETPIFIILLYKRILGFVQGSINYSL